MRTLRCLSLVLGLLVVLAAGPARAALVFGGSGCSFLFGFCIASWDIDPSGSPPTTMAAFYYMDDGFGNNAGTFFSVLPQVPIGTPPLDLSQSFSTPSVGNANTSILLTSSLTTVGPNEFLTVSSVGSITLSQTDLNPGSPNGWAYFRLVLIMPFMFSGAPGTMFIDLDFDVSSPTLTQFGPADSFTATSCVGQGTVGDLLSACPIGSPGARTLASLGSGDPLPAIDPVAGFSESIVADIQYTAIFALDFAVKNDFGPTTLSLDGFTLTAGAVVPEPGTALLLSVGLLGICAARRRNAHA